VAAAPTRHVDALGGDARYSPQRTRGTRKRLSTAAPRAQACALSRPAARRASAACVRLSLAHYQSSSAPLVSQPEACRCLKRGLSRAEFSTDQSIWPPRASQMWTLTSANVWDHSRNANLWERRRDLSEIALGPDLRWLVSRSSPPHLGERRLGACEPKLTRVSQACAKVRARQASFATCD
jgi:hypothetical protein